jgi:rod shape-determining protein MreD
MLRLPLLAAATYLLFALQTSLAPQWAVAGAVPRLTCAALIPLAALCGARMNLICAACWGFLSDLLSDGRIGTGAICFTLTAAGLSRLLANQSRTLPGWKPTSAALLVCGCVAAEAAFRLLVNGQATSVLLHWPMIVRQTALTALPALLFALAAIRLTQRNSIFTTRSAEPVSNRWTMLTE